MNKVNTKAYILTAIIAAAALPSPFRLHAQSGSKITLSESNASWTSVIGGKAVCPPQNTSYGFVVLTDGRMLSACTENGVKIWERAVPGTQSPFLAVLGSDFIAAASGRRTLSLINPSGLHLWSAKSEFDITSNPTEGRDGRIFIRGRTNIACYGINGICKWTLETKPLKDIPLCELNDGSLVALFSDAEGGRSTGIRISPFGKVIESLSFAGIVEAASSCAEGLLLLFSGGGMGLCSVRDGRTITAWAVPSESPVFAGTSAQGGRFVDAGETLSFACVGKGNSTKIILFNTADGSVSKEFIAEGIRCASIVCSEKGGGFSGIFLADTKSAALYNSSGRLLWNASLQDGGAKSGWNYIAYTQSNHLVVCRASWAVDAYRTTQIVLEKGGGRGRQDAGKRQFGYESYYDIKRGHLSADSAARIYSAQKDGGLRDILKGGLYGGDEPMLASYFLASLTAYRTEQQRRPSARGLLQNQTMEDSRKIESMLSELPLLGTSDCPAMLERLIPDEKNTSTLRALFKAASDFGYDPDGAVLDAIGKKARSVPARSASALITACDAVYAICRFMGRPALYSRGMEILTELLNPQYDGAVREKARATLAKITALEI